MKKRLVMDGVVILAAIGVARAEGLGPLHGSTGGYAIQGGDFTYIRAVVAAWRDAKPSESRSPLVFGVH